MEPIKRNDPRITLLRRATRAERSQRSRLIKEILEPLPVLEACVLVTEALHQCEWSEMHGLMDELQAARVGRENYFKQ